MWRKDRISPPFEFKRIRPQKGDILVIKEPTEDEDYRKSVVKRIQDTAKHEILVVFVKHRLSDVKILTEKQMNNLGWYRKDGA